MCVVSFTPVSLVRLLTLHCIWPRTIIIDVGKTFLPAAMEFFPKYGMRKVDAVLLTHAHADGETASVSRVRTYSHSFQQ